MNDYQPPDATTKTPLDHPNQNPTEPNNSTITEDSATYTRRVAHAASIKIVNNLYEIPVYI